jgi:hypothetical protein
VGVSVVVLDGEGNELGEEVGEAVKVSEGSKVGLAGCRNPVHEARNNPTKTIADIRMLIDGLLFQPAIKNKSFIDPDPNTRRLRRHRPSFESPPMGRHAIAPGLPDGVHPCAP